MPTFILDGFDDPVEVHLTDNISQDQLLNFPAFNTWRSALKENLERQNRANHPFHASPFSLRRITIQSVDWAGSRILFVKLVAEIEDAKHNKLPGIAFLRGGSVAILMILRPNDLRDERLVIMTEQARVPAGSLAFKEIPAGMIDNEKTFAGAAAKEIEEETQLKIPSSELIDLTKLALREAADTADTADFLQPAMYPSPGGSDEYIPIFLWVKELDRLEIERLRGRLTGLRSRGELIRLYVCDYEDVWKVGARDAKTLAAWALYEGLNRSGVLQQELKRLKDETLERKCIEKSPSKKSGRVEN